MNLELETIKTKVMAKYKSKQHELEVLENEIIEAYKLLMLGKANISSLTWYGQECIEYGCNPRLGTLSEGPFPVPIPLKICEDNEERLRKLHQILMEEVRKV